MCAACVGSSLSQSKTRKVGVCCSWLPHFIVPLIQFGWRASHGKTKHNRERDENEGVSKEEGKGK